MNELPLRDRLIIAALGGAVVGILSTLVYEYLNRRALPAKTQPKEIRYV
jgi:hypothetical protein